MSRFKTVPESICCERGWRCLRVAGTLPFTAVGILAGLTQTLATAGVSVFTVSTFDTDYVLMKDVDFDRACTALRGAGYEIGPADCAGGSVPACRA